jgi:nitroreductase
MDILPEILERRSVRSYKTDPVEPEKLERILQAARLAPSAKNRQEWRFIAVRDGSRRQKIQSAAFGQDHVGQAPVIVVCCTTNISYRMPNGQLSHPIDLSFAACSMVLQATRENLGSCVVTTFKEQEVRELLSIPFAMRVVMLVLVGYTDKKPEAPQRKDLRRIVSYDHW